MKLNVDLYIAIVFVIGFMYWASWYVKKEKRKREEQERINKQKQNKK